MQPTSLSTASLPSAVQFDVWREWFWPVIDIAPQAPKPDEFLATNKVWYLGGPVASCVSAPSTAVSRSKKNILSAPVDHWVLTCCRHGMTTMETNETCLNAAPGMPFVWSLGQRSESRRSQVNRTQIFLPRDMFQEIAAELDDLCGSSVNTPMGAVLGDYILALERWLPTMTPELLPRLGEAVRSMVVACVAPSTERMECASDEMGGLRLDRVGRVVREHLKSPSLTPDALCRMAGMSRSSLYRLFEHVGGVARYIRRQRLLYAYRVLGNPANRASILEISEELCFTDLSSFSRAFRQEFGCCPRDVRSAAGTAKLAARLGPAPQTTDIACFGDLLSDGMLPI